MPNLDAEPIADANRPGLLKIGWPSLLFWACLIPTPALPYSAEVALVFAGTGFGLIGALYVTWTYRRARHPLPLIMNFSPLIIVATIALATKLH